MHRKGLAKTVALSTGCLVSLLLIMKKGKPTSETLQATVDTISKVSKPENMFGGATQAEIDEIVKNTYKGFRAIIEDDVLTYFYRSASGKSKATTQYIVDDEGNLIKIFESYFSAKSPRFFSRALQSLLKSKA